MRGRRAQMIVRLGEAARAQLFSCFRARKTPVGLAKRAWAVLLPADRRSCTAAACQVDWAIRHVRK